MAAFAGTFLSGLQIQRSPIATSCFGKGTKWTYGPTLRALGIFLGAAGQPGAVQVAHSAGAGTDVPGYGRDLFNRILIKPRRRAAGSVLSDLSWSVEVWNTWQRSARHLSSIAVSGTGGLAISGGPTAMDFWPGQSQVYLATLPRTGDASIANAATWNFTADSGTDLAVTGTRVTVFSPRMDWSQAFREVLSWKTDLRSAYDGTEQRACLRSVPRYSLSYRVLTCSLLDTVQLEALLYGWQAQVYGVPVWPEKTPLTSALAAGGTTLTGDFGDRPSFEAGGLCMVWVDQQRFEAFEIEIVASGQITLASPAQGTWPAGAWVVPLRRGRLSAGQPLGRPVNWLTADTFTFSCEAL